MATLYVRDFPDEIYDRIKEYAADNRRSLSSQVIILMNEALAQKDILESRKQALDRIAQRRRSQSNQSTGIDSLALLREDRDR